MARRRAIIEDQNHDEEFNMLSLEAEHLWYRALSISDDFGVVPAEPYTLRSKTNLKDKVARNLDRFFNEIVGAGLGVLFEYEGKRFFAFKPETFNRVQSQFNRKRSVSEYLRLKKADVDKLLSRTFPDFPGTSEKECQSVPSKEYSVKSEVVKSEEGRLSELPVTVPFPESDPEDRLSAARSRANQFDENDFATLVMAEWRDTKLGKVYAPFEEVELRKHWRVHGTTKLLEAIRLFALGGYRKLGNIGEHLEGRKLMRATVPSQLTDLSERNDRTPGTVQNTNTAWKEGIEH